MYVSEVEILSDETNNAVMRHPQRGFPGSLVQGDTLFALCPLADKACAATRVAGAQDAFEPANELRNALWDRLNHYKAVLAEHDMQAPFSEDHTP